MEYKLNVNQLKEYSPLLKAGDRVLLSGIVFTSRDAAHKRIAKAINENKKLPYDIKGAVIYYAGPTPAPQHLPIGSCGPTTSGRMDQYSPMLLDMGLAAMIGKGERDKATCEAISRNKAIYFCAIGGAGALAAKAVKSCEVVAYEDLGCESVKKIEIKDFPLTVAIDCNGGNVFERATKR